MKAASFLLPLSSGYSFKAELRAAGSVPREERYVAVEFAQPDGSASLGVALEELLAPDFWGRCEDDSLALIPHAGKGRREPEASRYKLTAAEARAFLAWLHLELQGIARPGPRLRPSVLSTT